MVQHAALALLLMTSTPGAPGLSFSEFSHLVGYLVDGGIAGAGALAFIMGWIVPRGTYQEARSERDSWKDMYQHERDAHQATREAMLLASQRAESGVEAAQVAKVFLEAIHARQTTAGT